MTRGPCPCPICNAQDECDECHEPIGPKDETFEYGNDSICKRCWERHLDESEVYFEGDR